MRLHGRQGARLLEEEWGRSEYPVILPDTSVWIHYLRPGGRADLKQVLREELLSGRVWTCQVVRYEILVGAADDGRFEELHRLFGSLPDVPMDGQTLTLGARIGYELRRRGTPVPMPDVLVSACALQGGPELWYADEDFEKLREVAPDLRLRSFL